MSTYCMLGIVLNTLVVYDKKCIGSEEFVIHLAEADNKETICWGILCTKRKHQAGIMDEEEEKGVWV